MAVVTIKSDLIRAAVGLILLVVAVVCIVLVAQISNPYSPWVYDPRTGMSMLAEDAVLCMSQTASLCQDTMAPPGTLVAHVPVLIGSTFLVHTSKEGYLVVSYISDTATIAGASTADELVALASPQAYFGPGGGVVLGDSPFQMQPGAVTVLGKPDGNPPIQGEGFGESLGGFAFTDPIDGSVAYLDRVCTAWSPAQQTTTHQHPSKCGMLLRSSATGTGTVFVAENQVILGDVPAGFAEASSKDFVLVGGNMTILSYTNLGSAVYCIPTDNLGAGVQPLDPLLQGSALHFTVYSGGRTCSYDPPGLSLVNSQSTTAVPQGICLNTDAYAGLMGIDDAFRRGMSFVVVGSTMSLYSGKACATGVVVGKIDTSLGCPQGRTFGVASLLPQQQQQTPLVSP